MYKIGIVLCYMGGHLHEYFDKFLIGCKYNPTIDWHLFTDDHRQFDYPENVKVHYTILEEIRSRAESSLGRKVLIDAPYALCNYKVMYGEIFKEELREYDFWGYCDCDLIFGDIRAFLTEEILSSYGKVGICGHLTLMRNDDFHRSIWKEVAEAFVGYMGVNIFEAGGSVGWSFDEHAGINRYFNERGLPQYSKRIFESAAPDRAGFIPDYRDNYEKGLIRRIRNRKNCMPWRIRKHVILEFDHGKMYRICLIHEEVVKEEVCYAHFPGGKKFINRELGDHFFLIPCEFLDEVELTPEWLRAHSEEDHLSHMIRRKYIWYRGVASKYFPGIASVVKKITRYEARQERKS